MEFNKENIDKIIIYINMELKKNKKMSVNKVCDKIGIKQSTFKTWAHKSGYSFDINSREYTKVKQNDKAPAEPKAAAEEILSSTLDIEKLEELVDLLEPIKKLIINYNKNTLGPSRAEHSELNPPVITKVKQKLFKIDADILQEWEQFVTDHKQFKVQNLISLALKEFVDKYK